MTKKNTKPTSKNSNIAATNLLVVDTAIAPYYYKVIEYRKDEDGDSRAVCQLLFYLYETEDKRSGEVYHSIEPVVMVSRNIEERLDLTISHPKRSIEECERIAKEFMKWVDVYVDIE